MQRFAQASYALVISSTFAGVLLRIFEHIYLMVVRIAIVVAQIDIPIRFAIRRSDMAFTGAFMVGLVLKS